MIDVSLLYCGSVSGSAPHRYGLAVRQDLPAHQRMAVARSAAGRRPVVVWNVTRTCNLRCVHCYTNSDARQYPGELSTDEARGVIDDLAAFGVPVVLFSGGEPLMRPDIDELIGQVRDHGLHAVLSTNGTLIDKAVAERLAGLTVTYVGLSLDSAEPATHDGFRGTPGAFERTMRGFDAAREAGLKTGLRLTLTRTTYEGLDGVFDFLEDRRIPRACFYHLVPTGRGTAEAGLSLAESRRAVEVILRRTRELHDRGATTEVLTVDNHCDGPLIYLTLRAASDPRAEAVHRMLTFNGGGLWSSGVGIACIDETGGVHPDQFSRHAVLGNVRERPFSAIWTDESNELLAGLRDRKPRIKGRCASCRFLDQCGGSLRVRAELVTGDVWAADPGCYLSDEEIAGDA